MHNRFCTHKFENVSFTVGQSADPNATLADHLLFAVLNLLKKEVSEHGRHLQQYFHLFLMYSNLGVQEVIIKKVFCISVNYIPFLFADLFILIYFDAIYSELTFKQQILDSFELKRLCRR